MSGLDRTSREYLLDSIARAMMQRPVPNVFGLVSDALPESFEHLQAVVEEKRNDACGLQSEIDGFMGMLALLPDRDDVVKRMPATGEEIALLVIEEAKK